MLILAGRVGPFLRFGGILLDAFVGDGDGVRDLLGGGAGEGAVEPGDVDATLTQLGLDGGVHGGEELIAELVQNAVNVDVGQQAFSCCHDRAHAETVE